MHLQRKELSLLKESSQALQQRMSLAEAREVEMQNSLELARKQQKSEQDERRQLAAQLLDSKGNGTRIIAFGCLQ